MSAARLEELRRAAAACEEALARYYASDKILLRLDSAAQAIDSPIETVRTWIRRGLIVPTRIGRNCYVSRDDLIAFVKAHREPTPPPPEATA